MSKAMYIKNPKKWVNRELPIDPRLPIAHHIGWVRSDNTELSFTSPEPDNYNRAILADHPVYCDLVKDNVFFRDTATKHWWTVSYVPEEQRDEFDAWAEQQDYYIFWKHPSAKALRGKPKLLHARKNTDITPNERLFCMGYYSNFKSKYFTDTNDTMLLDRLGPIRSWVLDSLHRRHDDGIAREDYDADEV